MYLSGMKPVAPIQWVILQIPWKIPHIPLKTLLYIDKYIYRVKAGGSPEASCILFVWIWKNVDMENHHF